MTSQPIPLPSMRPTSSLLGSLSGRDRRLLFSCLAIAAVLIIVVAILTPQQDEDNPTPSSFSTTTHGAEAAYLALAQSGYRIERWEQPLERLALQSDEHTVLIVAEPNISDAEAVRPAIEQFLQRGGRVLATGITGAAILPNSHAAPNPHVLEPDCKTEPEGLGSIANSGVIHMRPYARWQGDLPSQRVQYTCSGNAGVVSYAVGKGQVVWWANSLPLENAAITRDGDLTLLLSSIGSGENVRIVWDESLHGDQRGLWSYAAGTPVHLLWVQFALLALLLVLSYSRRSGPLLPDPIITRDTQLEFVHSLGALYDKAGATNTAVRIAYDRFRLLLGRTVGTPQPGTTAAERAEEIVSQVNARVGRVTTGLQPEILECEEATYAAEPLSARRALTLVRSLWLYEVQIQQGGKQPFKVSREENPK